MSINLKGHFWHYLTEKWSSLRSTRLALIRARWAATTGDALVPPWTPFSRADSSLTRRAKSYLDSKTLKMDITSNSPEWPCEDAVNQVRVITHNVAEGRLDDFRLSGISKAKISRIEFLDSKWLYPPKRLVEHMSLADCPLNSFGARKKSFLSGHFANFAQKSNSKGSKNLKSRWISLKPYFMFNKPFLTYKYYKIVPKPIHADSATSAIEYCFKDFSKYIPYV